MNPIDDLKFFLENCETAPNFSEMPRRSLSDKGVDGPTGAHVIEEIHTPFNLAYISITTGTTAFQNIAGVTHNEISDRISASIKALELSGVKRGDKILITYPPLVNVFSKEALEIYGVEHFFLERSCRDALLLALAEKKPNIVIGESSFLRASIEDAKKLDIIDLIPKGIVFLAAGTPLDLDFVPAAENLVGGVVHDLYGCQEFGWLAVDGIPLRKDISLVPEKGENFHLVAGGLPTGDCFPKIDNGHICNIDGKIITYSRIRTNEELELTVLESTAKSIDTLYRLAKTILRIKGKIVRISKNVVLNSEKTVLSLANYGENEGFIISGKDKTLMFDTLLEAQMAYQSENKTDPTWLKRR